MLDLVALGPEKGQRWRRELVQDVVVRLGRTPKEGWDVPWDLRVSREHADLQVVGGRLQVRCLKNATNAVYVGGEPFREVIINAGDDFRIGETTFRVERVPEDVAAKVAPQHESSGGFDPNETNVVCELGDTDNAQLEAALARSEAEAHQATELADQRFAEIIELKNEADALRAAKPTGRDSNFQEELGNANLHAEGRAAEIARLREENNQLREETEKLQHLLAEASTQRDVLTQRASELESSLSDSRAERGEAESALQQAVARLQREKHAFEQLNSEREDLKSEIDSLMSRMMTGENSLRSAKQESDRLARLSDERQHEIEALRVELFELKRKSEGSSLARVESLSASRKASQSSAKSSQSDSEKLRPGGTDETIDARFDRGSSGGQELREFGQYRILTKVGQGGMGAVFKAVHTRLDKVVALKLLAESRAHSPDHAKRFDREMKAIGRLDHENLVRAIDAGEIDDRLYLVMEFVDGLDLSELVSKIGQLPLADACEIARQCAQGMDYVHRRKLVHRDLKPSNLMLTRAGQVKILDLGLAQLNDWGAEGLTQSGQIMGTLDYMAPEQAGDSRLVDHRSDIYSLGCAFYQMLAGRSPFSNRGNESFAELILAHATKPLPPLAALRPEVTPQLVDLVDQMTAKQPEDRPQGMNEVAQRLEPLCSDASLSSLLATAASPIRKTSASAGNSREIEQGEKDDTAATGDAMMGTRTNSSQILSEPGTPVEETRQSQPSESRQSRQ